MSEKTVTIFGTAGTETDSDVYDLAFQAGRMLAAAGFTIANGGYGGTMLAAAKGAAEAGGKVVGVTCSAFKRTVNKYVSREIVTSSLDERLDTLIKLGQAYVVLPGGTGTLLELAKIWELKNKGFLEKDKPIILVGKFWMPLLELIAVYEPESINYLQQVDSPEQIKELIADI